MRYLTVRLSPTAGGGFHPVGRRLSEEPSIRREAVHYVELLSDDTVVTLAEGSGDRERYEEIMSELPAVEEFLVSGEERWIATSRFEANESLRRMLELRRDFDLVVETPIDVHADGSSTTTFIGSESVFRELFEATTDAANVDVEVIETGEYNPDAETFERVLTTRQQEVLEAAVELGYYSVPREATHEDVAEAVGVAPTTVGDHLRKVEARVFGTLVR